jgi:hypothetical protein
MQAAVRIQAAPGLAHASLEKQQQQHLSKSSHIGVGFGIPIVLGVDMACAQQTVNMAREIRPVSRSGRKLLDSSTQNFTG